MRQFLELIRWRNLVIILLTQLCTYLFLREPPCRDFILDYRFLLLALATTLLAAAGYLINDYSDIRIDAVNKPEKVIVNRFIQSRWVLVFHSLFNGLGILIGFFLHPYLGVIHTLVAYLLWRYSVRLKYRLFWGNLAVALLLALTLVEVYFPFRDIQLQWLLFYACFAFLTGLVREILKDVEDAEGDAAFGCRTVPIVYGIFKTKLILIYLLLTMVFLLVFVLLYFAYWARDARYVLAYPLYLGGLVLLPLLAVLWQLKDASRKKDFRRLSTWIKGIMLTGILSMALRCVVQC